MSASAVRQRDFARVAAHREAALGQIEGQDRLPLAGDRLVAGVAQAGSQLSRRAAQFGGAAHAREQGRHQCHQQHSDHQHHQDFQQGKTLLSRPPRCHPAHPTRLLPAHHILVFTVATLGVVGA
ncbi:MAG: hypothetical protein MZW92_09375 [Comamonadaceae bacterium]|nr:hypothetical protein [Comamonadaceae bacterium]